MGIINILGINVNNLKKNQALKKIEEFLSGEKQRQIATINPEMILAATGHDEEFFYILNRVDLSLPDGVGLKIAGWFMGANLARVTGADLVKDILALAQKQGKRIAIFNWRGGLSKEEDINLALKKQYPGLKAKVVDVGRQEQPDFNEINSFAPGIIFCTLGAPYQEKFIFHSLPELPSVKIGLGVGGAFDFLTGEIKRAPKMLRLLGLEWLWRLYKQPKRWKRIYNAVMVFPYKFFRWRFILPFRYRPNVACLLYKKENGNYKILIVERTSQAGHWQLPQGGTDGEDLVSAGKRELSEEINNDKFKTIAAFPETNIYEFGNEMSKFGVLSRLAAGYRGQKQGLFIAEFIGADSDIKINFWEHRAWRWVDAEKLLETVYPSRRTATKIFIEKFWQTVNK